MRSIFIKLLVVGCVGCGAAPRSTEAVMAGVAAEFVASHNDGDEARLLALVNSKTRARWEAPRDSWNSLERHLGWLRAELGACGEPTLMWSSGERGRRFTYACERGALEVAFILDEAGQIIDLRSGAAGVPAPAPLQSAAETVAASLPWSSPTPRPFKHNLDRPAANELGSCRLVRPWVVGPRQALFHATCEHGDAAVLRVGVHEDGTIAGLSLWRVSDVYFGPPVTVPAESA